MKKMFLGLLLLMATLSIHAQNNGLGQKSMKAAFEEVFRNFDQEFAEAFKNFDLAFAKMDSVFAANFHEFDQQFAAHFQADFTTSNQLDTSMTASERTYLLNLLEETQSLYNQGTAEVSTVQVSFKPGINRWSVLEVMEHIAVVEMGIFSIVQGELNKPVDPSRRSEIKVSAEQIVQILTNRTGKVQAPEQVKPTGRFPNATVALEAFRRQHEQIMMFVQNSNADLHNRYWKHPATGVIDLYQTLVLIAAHTQRHLLQIEEIKQTEGFPK